MRSKSHSRGSSVRRAERAATLLPTANNLTWVMPAKGGQMKTYLSGSNPSIRVPVRALTLTNGESIRLYDTSGPYTDPDYAVDLKQGLPPLRRHWILERDDVEPGEIGRASCRER